MTQVRKYKASSFKQDDRTAIGISEYDGKTTIAIHSLYFPTKLSNRDIFINTVQHIERNINEDERVYLRLFYIQFTPSWKRPYSKYFVRREYGRKAIAYKEAMQLADDALKRESSICELFGKEGLPTHEPTKKP